MPEERELTVMFTDMKGYTARTASAAGDDVLRLLREHDLLVLTTLERRGGTLIKTIGDALMLTYKSPSHAVLGAVEAQEALRAHNANLPKDSRIDIRIGIHSGPVMQVEGDVFGNTVNVAARIESKAKPREVCFSEAVYQGMTRGRELAVELGRHRLKGVPEPVRLYKIRRPGALGRLDAFWLRVRQSLPARLTLGLGRAVGLALVVSLLLTTLLLHNVWFSCALLAALLALLPLRSVRLRKLRFPSGLLSIALLAGTYSQAGESLQHRLDELSNKLHRRGPRAMTVAECSSVYLLTGFAWAARGLVARDERVMLSLHELVPADGPRHVESDLAMISPKVRRPLAAFVARTAREPAPGAKMTPVMVDLSDPESRSLGLPISSVQLRAKLVEIAGQLRVEVTGNARVNHLRRGAIPLFGEDVAEDRISIDGNLLAILEARGWLHPYRLRWHWSLAREDLRVASREGRR